MKIDKYAKENWLPPHGWKNEKKSADFIAQAHKQRQNVFIGKCLREMKEAGHDWVFVADADEFAIFNYIHKDEDPNLYDSIVRDVRTKENITTAREKYAPVRNRLPALQEHVTIADFIHGEQKEKCYRLPSLKFSAHQARIGRVELSPSAELLVSLVQHRTGPKEGLYSKTILDVSQLEAEFLDYERVDSVHNPNRLICGDNGISGSGTDYIASVLRLNRHAAGSAEQYAESGGDFRGSKPFERFLTDQHFDPVGENSDNDYWIDWFIKKVGLVNAEKLLFKPLLTRHKEMAHSMNVKDLNAVLTSMQIIPPPKNKRAVVINDEGEADEER